MKKSTQRLKTWRVLAEDNSPDGETIAEYIVAAANRTAARAAFSRLGLRGTFAAPATVAPIDIALENVGIVFRRDYLNMRWIECSVNE